jgi:hypothetical protein
MSTPRHLLTRIAAPKAPLPPPTNSGAVAQRGRLVCRVRRGLPDSAGPGNPSLRRRYGWNVRLSDLGCELCEDRHEMFGMACLAPAGDVATAEEVSLIRPTSTACCQYRPVEAPLDQGTGRQSDLEHPLGDARRNRAPCRHRQEPGEMMSPARSPAAWHPIARAPRRAHQGGQVGGDQGALPAPPAGSCSAR